MSVATTAAGRRGGYCGPAFLARGLRPFFLLAGVYAVVALLLWLGVLAGHCNLPTAFDPLAWHVHEMLFGFAQAAVAGFILTAVPNWTGRPALNGGTLALLALLWVAGRLAVAFSATLGPAAAAVVDLSFPIILLLFVANDILRARLWHGLLLVGVLSLFLVANSLMHLSIAGDLPQLSDVGRRLGLGVMVMLISLIGGRVIPSFTGNWLEARGEARPQGFGLVDRVALAATAAALVAWSFVPEHAAAAALLGLAGVAQALRLARWRGHRTLAEPLVWSLHLGYAWLPLGLTLMAAAVARPDLVPTAAGLHALAAGGIAGMILAMTTRATLGHTGRTLHADGKTLVLYLMISLGATVRVAAALIPALYLPLLAAAGLLWLAAFGLFVLCYGPMLVTPRADGRAP